MEKFARSRLLLLENFQEALGVLHKNPAGNCESTHSGWLDLGPISTKCRYLTLMLWRGPSSFGPGEKRLESQANSFSAKTTIPTKAIHRCLLAWQPAKSLRNVRQKGFACPKISIFQPAQVVGGWLFGDFPNLPKH